MIERRKINMLETLIVVLLIFWLLGMVTSTTLGGFINILLVIAILMILVRIIKGKPIM